MARAFAKAFEAKVSEALLLRSVEYGESDVIATLLTELEGTISVLVRGARKSTKRTPGTMEPFHGVRVRYETRGDALAILREARVARVRGTLTSSLEAMDAAGRALRWCRELCPPKTPEPALWLTLNALLDALDKPEVDVMSALAEAGVRLLADLGYSLDFERCVRCGTQCPADRPGTLDFARGGLICRGCGGGHLLLGVGLRAAAIGAQRGERVPKDHANALLDIVTRAMAAHGGFGG